MQSTILSFYIRSAFVQKKIQISMSIRMAMDPNLTKRAQMITGEDFNNLINVQRANIERLKRGERSEKIINSKEAGQF